MPANVAGRGEGTDTQMKMSGRAEGMAEGMGVRVSHGRGDHGQAQPGEPEGLQRGGNSVEEPPHGPPGATWCCDLHITFHTLAVSPAKGMDFGRGAISQVYKAHTSFLPPPRPRQAG